MILLLREHIPIEQGLRREEDFNTESVLPQRAYSNRTRIKTPSIGQRPTNSRLREHIPIEQGLRLNPLCCSIDENPQRAYSNRTRIKTRINWLRIILWAQRAYSNRTRIKTFCKSIIAFAISTQRAYSNRTRIKTTVWLLYSEHSHASESIFQ